MLKTYATASSFAPSAHYVGSSGSIKKNANSEASTLLSRRDRPETLSRLHSWSESFSKGLSKEMSFNGEEPSVVTEGVTSVASAQEKIRRNSCFGALAGAVGNAGRQGVKKAMKGAFPTPAGKAVGEIAGQAVAILIVTMGEEYQKNSGAEITPIAPEATPKMGLLAASNGAASTGAQILAKVTRASSVGQIAYAGVVGGIGKGLQEQAAQEAAKENAENIPLEHVQHTPGQKARTGLAVSTIKGGAALPGVILRSPGFNPYVAGLSVMGGFVSAGIRCVATRTAASDLSQAQEVGRNPDACAA